MEKYREKMQETPVDDVCEVSPEIGVPITEKLSYVTNEELSEMFVELLAKASHFKSANVAHPSFVNIINSVSPDEAILLKSIKHTPLIPCIEVRLQKINANQYNVLDPLMVKLPCLSELTYPGNVAAYFSNLEGLGIVRVLRDSFMVGDSNYEPIESLARERYSKVSDSVSDGELRFRRRQIEFTSFGRLFLEACFGDYVGECRSGPIGSELRGRVPRLVSRGYKNPSYLKEEGQMELEKWGMVIGFGFTFLTPFVAAVTFILIS